MLIKELNQNLNNYFNKKLLVIVFSGLTSLFSLATHAQESEPQSTTDKPPVFIEEAAMAEPNNDEQQEQLEAQSENNIARNKQYKYYQVEVILFEHKNRAHVDEENWLKPIKANNSSAEIESTGLAEKLSENPINENALEPDLEIARAYLSPQQRLARFNINQGIFSENSALLQIVAEKDYILYEEAAQIKRSGHYRLLGHLAWIQPGLSKDEAKGIAIYGQGQRSLEGSIKIVLSRFLHTKVDLVAKETKCQQLRPSLNKQLEQTGHTTQVPEANNRLDPRAEQAYQPGQDNSSQAQLNKPGLAKNTEITIDTNTRSNCFEQGIAFKQSRKMRSNELHYIDNPGLGILVFIHPVKNTGQNTASLDSSADNVQ